MRGTEGGGPSVLPIDPKVPPIEQKKPDDVSEVFENKGGKDWLFGEFFAGEGGLTKAMIDVNIKVLPPNELDEGGTDFADNEQVEELKSKLWELAKTQRLALHFAPPCATFSRARDRSMKTRLRSSRCPAGLPSKRSQTRTANKVAKNAWNLAKWAAEELQALTTFENPQRSYMWQYLDEHCDTSGKHEIDLSACMFGAAYQKHTRLWCFGWKPSKLAKICTLRGDAFTCGRTRDQGHEVLEFGKGSTRDAAAYTPGLCRSWALALAEEISVDTTTAAVMEQVQVSTEGKVKRHVSRGVDADSLKKIRDEEDARSTAGMRNPALLQRRWPQLWSTMAAVRTILEKAHAEHEELRRLSELCGKDPPRAQPSNEVLNVIRADILKVLGKDAAKADDHHPASPWRFELVRAVLEATADSDLVLADWLQGGAPMGLAMDIEPGGHFPPADPAPGMDMEMLEHQERWETNHPSFNKETATGEQPPGPQLVSEYLEAGFGRLYESPKAASSDLGGDVHPAPLGTISKPKPDGSLKHRVIQDLRRNNVNDAVRLPERQVLPRGVDHGIDMAQVASKVKGANKAVLIIDFKDAFMSIPLADCERKFNCANVPKGLIRQRAALDATEPSEGTCVVWRVLGFGGKPNPLIYSRAASFAARSAQALFDGSKGQDELVRSQLYVDDPAITVGGATADIHKKIDLLLLWWLVLGIPLAWKKGSLHFDQEPHEWIGVRYSWCTNGDVKMELPPAYLDELALILEPFCSTTSSSTWKDAERMVGKAGRVAQVVPAARPFLSGLWAALAGTRQDLRTGRNPTHGMKISTSRFATSARWLRALILGDDRTPMPLTRTIRAQAPTATHVSKWVAQFDASTTGGGAVLRFEHQIMEYFVVQWSDQSAGPWEATPGNSRFQTFWEMLMVLLVLVVWGANFQKEKLLILGDNTGALSAALNLKGKGLLSAIAREIAWRQIRHLWEFDVGHVPTELNTVADALSRLHEPHPPRFPSSALAQAQRREAPDCSKIWRVVAW